MSLARLTNNWLLDFSGDDLPEAAETRSHQMASFARHTPINSLVSMTMSLVAALSLWQGGGQGFVLPWAGLIWTVGLWHLFKWWRRRDMPRPRRVSGRGMRKATLWSLLGGIIWGSTVFLYPQASDTHRLLIMITAIGMGAGAATTLGAIPIAAAAFIVAAVVPWIVYFLVQYNVEYFALACMALILMLAMLCTTRIVYAGFIESVKARRANAALLAQFHSERDEWFEISDTSEAFALFDDQDCLLLWNENYRRILSLPEDSLYRGAVRKQLLRLCAAPVEVVEGRLTREQWIDRHLRLQDETDISLIEQLSNGCWLKSSARRTSLDHTVTLHVDVTALKSQESALIESEARFQAFLEHAPVELGIKDLEGRYVFVSREFERVQGVSNEDAQGKRAGEIYAPEVAEELRAHDDEVVRSGQASQREIVIPGVAGTHTFLTVKFPIRDADGEIAGIGAVATDITESKAHERALRESEARLQAFLDHSPAEIALKDTEGRYLLLNRQFEKLYGVVAQDLVGKTSADVFPEEIARSLQDHDRAVLASGEVIQREEVVPLKDGEHTFLAVKFPLFDTDGEISSIGAVAIDITERKRAEEELERSRALLSDAVEALADGFVIFDSEERMVLCNSRYRQLLHQIAGDLVPGITLQEGSRKTAEHCVGLSTRAEIDAWVQDRMARLRSGDESFEQQLIDGRWIRIRDDHLPNGWTVGIRTDITELKQREQALQESEARLAEAIEAMNEGFVLFDQDERLIVCNSKYRELYPDVAELFVPGTKFEDIIQASARCEEVEEAIGRPEEWARERLERFRNPAGFHDECVQNERWIRVSERRTEDAGTVGIRTDITELKQRQMALEESEQRFRAIADDTPIMLWVFDAQDKPSFYNRALLEFHGLSMEQALAWDYLEDIHPQDRAGFDALEDEWRERPRPQKTEYRLRCADGGYRWVLDVSFPRWADDGTYLGSIGTYVDITDQKQAQDALRESEKRFQDFAESSADWFWEMDADLRFTYMSPNVERMAGVPPEWHYGKSREDILGEDFDRGIWDAHLRSLRAREAFRDFVYPRGGADVETRWLRASGVPVFGEDGAFLGYRGSGSDVTAAVEAEQALKASEEQLRLVTDSLPVLIAYCDRDETYLFVNKTCAEWYGRPRQEIIGESVQTLVPEFYDDIKPRIETVLSGQRVSFGMSVTYGDGKTRDVQVLYVPRFDAAGEVEGYFVLTEDVSERKRAEEALREREARLHELQRELEHVSRISAMGHLSSALAHELNQPLTAIMNYAQAARRMLNANGGANSPKVEEMIDKATTQAGRAGDVIRRLRGLFERGETEASRESINEVIEDAASLALVDSEVQKISYKLKLMEGLPLVMIDKIQIQQVILNLVRNAVEALEGAVRRELVIETSLPSDDAVEVAVCDSGPGLPAEIEQHMFEPFVTGKHGNMGVGLSISNRIIEAHGGRLWAESNAGGGTRFRFTLPSMKRVDRKHDG